MDMAEETGTGASVDKETSRTSSSESVVHFRLDVCSLPESSSILIVEASTWPRICHSEAGNIELSPVEFCQGDVEIHKLANNFLEAGDNCSKSPSMQRVWVSVLVSLFVYFEKAGV
ncbi:uncharacterized protein LOC113345826 [Papaver somniferum]|uniref:uncharacterized protein LOC113345826 n=1 Tax=Papaver somniferum TaxID=3469 RepID=UPI000E6F639F|nr:uncharacterized protein LOC113345826 [Papaver somniferum]